MKFFTPFILFLVALVDTIRARRLPVACNGPFADVSDEGIISRKSDAAHASRWLLVKAGSDVRHVAVTTAATEEPLGICGDEPSAAEEVVNVHLFGACEGTKRAVASEAIALTDRLFAAAGGKVQNLPVASGTYYMIGRPLSTAAADGDPIEFIPCYPQKVVVP